MLYCDRFFIGALLSVTAVTYYATPSEVINKVTLIPSAVARAFFPAFAESFVLSKARSVSLLNRGTNLNLLLVAPLIVAATTLAPLCLSAWLGHSFAIESASVLRWLAIGVLVNSTGQLPYTLVQAADRPDLVAKLSAIEFPIFLGAEYLLIRSRGIEGAAIAWSVRMSLETIGLWMMAYWLLPETFAIAIRTGALVATVLCLIAIGIWSPLSFVGQLLFLSTVSLIGFWAAWTYLLSDGDKHHFATLFPFGSKMEQQA
jgi:O-antigen/teichoic acid export membrane protein